MPVTSNSLGRISIGEYQYYEDAERAVDHLSDREFPVENLSIIGRDLAMVENVTGRLNWFRAAATGLGTGAWVGLLFGLLLSIFAVTVQGAAALLLGGLLWGAAFGLVIGLISYALTRGRRDFASRSAVVPTRYEILAEGDVAERARTELLALTDTATTGQWR